MIWRENGRGLHAGAKGAKGLGPQDPTKKFTHRVELLGQPLSQKNVFENLGPEPPLRGVTPENFKKKFKKNLAAKF